MSTTYTIPVYHISLVRDGKVKQTERPQIRHSRNGAEILRSYLAEVDREHFVVLLLNQKNRVIGIHTVSVGSMTASIVHPREVFKAAILSNAAAIICGHNHPSGDTIPSQEDRTLTARLVKAGELLGIPVLDHLVLGDDGNYYSFADMGSLKEAT